MPIIGAPQLPAPVEILDEAPNVEYWSASGRVTSLTDVDSGWCTIAGATGLGAPEFVLRSTASPARGGEVFRGVTTSKREIFIPIVIWGDTRAELLERFRGLVSDVDPRKGAGELRVAEADGRTRRIPVRYTDGLKGNEAVDQAGLRWRAVGLTFVAHDPSWLDVDDISLTWAYQSPPQFFPILPLHLASSQVLGNVEITNPGDEAAYPVWTITGPATGVTLTNTTTGEVLELTGSLSGGDTVTIDCRPGIKTVVDQTGANLWARLASSPPPILWKLWPGLNEADLGVAGAGAGSSVRLAFTPRYSTA